MKSMNFSPPLVEIPEGLSFLGSRLTDLLAGDRDKGGLQVYISTCFIGKYPVTNAEYFHFVDATGYSPPRHWTKTLPSGKQCFEDELADHPVTFIAWADAYNYCQWLSELTGHIFSLPTEAEWEKAARGPNSYIWPWGNQFDAKLCNSKEAEIDTTCSVKEFSKGMSPYGCYHMSGNVWEWCIDFYHPFSHQDAKLINPVNSTPARQRVVKGGSYNYDKQVVRCAGRDYINPDNEGGVDDGFRVALKQRNPKGIV